MPPPAGAAAVRGAERARPRRLFLRAAALALQEARGADLERLGHVSTLLVRLLPLLVAASR